MALESTIQSITLSNGLKFPMVGLGTYKTHGKPEVLAKAIKEAVACGYRHFDCAYCYENEEVIGKALKEAIDESEGKLKREDLFIVTKLWNTFHSIGKAEKAVDNQLKTFGFDYFDLYLMHWPMGFDEDNGMYPTDDKGNLLFSDVHYLETYRALEKMVEEKKVKSIGICNFNVEQLKDLLEHCRIKPVVYQGEVHPYYQNSEVVEFCQKNGIVVTGYANLGAPDRSWLQPEDPIVLEDELLKRLAVKYNKTIAQICLRWATQRNIVVIPKTVTPARLIENIDIFDFKLSDEDMEGIRKLEKGFQYYGFLTTKEHKFYPFKV